MLILLALACQPEPQPPQGIDPCATAALPARGPLEAEAAATTDPLSLARVRLREHHLTGDAGFVVLAEQAVLCRLARAPDDLDARRLQGEAWLQVHRFRDAQHAFAELVEQRDVPSDRLLLGDALLEQGLRDEAEPHFRAIAASHPSLDSFDRMGWWAWAGGDLEQAIHWGEQAVNAGSPDPERHAWALSQLGRYRWLAGEVPQELGHALLVHPGHREASYWLGRHLLSVGHPDAARHLAADGPTLRSAIALAVLGEPEQVVHDRAKQDPRGYAVWKLLRGEPVDLAPLQAERDARADPLTVRAHALGSGLALPPLSASAPADPELWMLAVLGDDRPSHRAGAAAFGHHVLPSRRHFVEFNKRDASSDPAQTAPRM